MHLSLNEVRLENVQFTVYVNLKEILATSAIVHGSFRLGNVLFMVKLSTKVIHAASVR